MGWKINHGNGSVILKFYRNLGFTWMVRFCARAGRKPVREVLCPSCWGNTVCLWVHKPTSCCSTRGSQGNGTKRLGVMLGLPCRAQLPFWLLGGCALPYLPAQQSLFFIPACASKAGAIPSWYLDHKVWVEIDCFNLSDLQIEILLAACKAPQCSPSCWR